MTTNVEIKTHDWPVSVVALDRHPDGSVAPTPMATVPPHSAAQHYMTDTRQLLITEMKLPPKDAGRTD